MKMDRFDNLQKKAGAAALALTATLLLAACGEKAAGGHEHGAAASAGAADHHAPAGGPLAAEKLTHFTGQSELFVEFAPLIVGQSGAFTAYVTRLDDFKPFAQGRLTVLLSGGNGPDERFVVDAPVTPGVFRPGITPKVVGERELTLIVETILAPDPAGSAAPSGGSGRSGRLTLTHELGPVTVYADGNAARAGASAAGATISFAKEQQWKIDFATAEAVRGLARTSVTATGNIKARPDFDALLVAPAAGVLRPVGAFPRLGQAVKQGQVLAVLSPRLGGETDQATLDASAGKARIALEQARRERERMAALFKDEAIAEKRLLEAEASERIAQAELDAALARAGAAGGGSGAGAGGITLRAPIDGSIADVSVTPGAFVAEGAPLFHLANTARLWLEVRVPESEIGRLGTPTAAAFSVDGYGQTFEIDGQRSGRLIAVGNVVDAATRTVPVIFEFDNATATRSGKPGAGSLRLGMSARVQVFSGSGQPAVLIPVSAVQDESGTQVVYVQTGGDSFERRVVQTGARDGANVAVLAGLEPGQRVVSKGAYLIRLSTTKSGPAGHAH